MADSYTLTDPQTGRPMQFDVPYNTGMEALNSEAIANVYRTQKLRDAEKAVSAAIQFQGLRGYQEALKAGEPAEKALTKYGPMMFYSRPTAFGPAVRAVRPPQLTPYQEAVLEERKQKALQPPPLDIRSGERGEIVGVNRATGEVRMLKEGSPALLKPPPLSLDQKAEAALATKQFQKASEELESTKPVAAGFFRSGNAKEIEAIQKKRDEARGKLQSLSNRGDIFDGSEKKLDLNTAKELLNRAGGDKDKARKLAKELGYTF